MKKIHISNKFIGEDQPTFIIAEAGVNHNGKLELAKKLVDIAVKTGADAVKFQTFKTEGLVTADADSMSYAKKNIRKDLKQIELIKSLELPYDNFVTLKNYCDDKKIIFLSTPHSFDAIDFLENLTPAYKFGSGDITNIPSLNYAAKKNKPIILGTGMANLDEVKLAIDSIKKTGNQQVIALHCTTNYPSSLDEVNLRAMITMQRELNCLVGYSDHSLGLTVPIIAASLGAVIIEKHFTIDKTLPGPDHKASLDPNELSTMIKEIRNVETILGSFDKKPSQSEKQFINLIRKSIVAKKDIDKGSTITEEFITIKRPGTGLNPIFFEEILGKKAKENIKKDTIIQKNLIGD
jgi:N-acetylneuraminate synthase/N,N'-diacetyllegionaminate synthase